MACDAGRYPTLRLRREIREVGLAGENELFGADDINMDSEWHGFFPLCGSSCLETPRHDARNGLNLKGFSFLEDFLDTAHHVESLLGNAVAFTVTDHLEALDRVFQWHVLAGRV